jgi:hypothetical protein
MITWPSVTDAYMWLNVLCSTVHSSPGIEKTDIIVLGQNIFGQNFSVPFSVMLPFLCASGLRKKS